MGKVNKIIDSYDESIQTRTLLKLREIFILEKSSFLYISQNGFLISFPTEISQDIEKMYNLTELITKRYYYDVRYYDKLQDHSQTEEQKLIWEKNRFTNLKNMRERLLEFQQVYENIKNKNYFKDLS